MGQTKFHAEVESETVWLKVLAETSPVRPMIPVPVPGTKSSGVSRMCCEGLMKIVGSEANWPVVGEANWIVYGGGEEADPLFAVPAET